MNNYANGAAYGQAASAAPAPMLPLPCKPANCKILHNLLDIQGHEILSSYGLKKSGGPKQIWQTALQAHLFIYVYCSADTLVCFGVFCKFTCLT